MLVKPVAKQIAIIKAAKSSQGVNRSMTSWCRRFDVVVLEMPDFGNMPLLFARDEAVELLEQLIDEEVETA